MQATGWATVPPRLHAQEIRALREAVQRRAAGEDVAATPLLPIRSSTAPGLGMLRRKTFLVVEDNPDDEALVARAFIGSGVEATIAVVRDGEEALLWLRANRDVALVLLDLNLPRLDGFGFLEAARQDPRFRGLPVVVFSSSDDPHDVERAYRLGATSYVQKPARYDDFCQVVKALLQYWLVSNRPPRGLL